MELNYLILALALLVSAAGIQDVLSRRISNIFPLVIVLLFLIATTLGGWSVEVWQNFASFILVLGIGAILFQRGILGGGDVKLWAAVALWFNLTRLPLLVLSRSEEHTSELQSLMRISYAVFCLKKKSKNTIKNRV